MNEPAPLFGLVLAGGSSKRMGQDKAALMLEGQSLLDRAAAALAPLVTDVYVSIRQAQQEDALLSAYPLIVDAEGFAGPAAGVLSAHQRYPHAAWLVVACDMPLVNARLLKQLPDAREPGAEAVYSES